MYLLLPEDDRDCYGKARVGTGDDTTKANTAAKQDREDSASSKGVGSDSINRATGRDEIEDVFADTRDLVKGCYIHPRRVVREKGLEFDIKGWTGAASRCHVDFDLAGTVAVAPLGGRGEGDGLRPGHP